MDSATALAPRSAEQRRHARLDIALAVSYAIHREGGGEASEMAETLSSDITRQRHTPHDRRASR
jgi:hypothetical protein